MSMNFHDSDQLRQDEGVLGKWNGTRNGTETWKKNEDSRLAEYMGHDSWSGDSDKKARL